MLGHRAREVFLGKLSTILGIDEQKLAQSFKEAGKQTIDQALQNGYLTQSQAEQMKERIEHGKRGFFNRSWARLARMHRGVQTIFEAVAAKFGESVDDLEKQLEAGKSLDELGRAKGISEDELRKTVVAAIKPQLDQAVKDGKIAPKMAEAFLHRIEQPAEAPKAA